MNEDIEKVKNVPATSHHSAALDLPTPIHRLLPVRMRRLKIARKTNVPRLDLFYQLTVFDPGLEGVVGLRDQIIFVLRRIHRPKFLLIPGDQLSDNSAIATAAGSCAAQHDLNFFPW